MQFRNSQYLFLILLFAFWGSAFGETQKTNLSDIKKSLVCLCDCNMTVEACQGSMACQTSEKLTNEAAGYIQMGMNKNDVLAAFVKKYGEHVLAAPTKKGFNLTAWILPFASIIFVGFVIVMAIKRWAKVPNRETLSKKNIIKEKDSSPYEQHLDEILHYLD